MNLFSLDSDTTVSCICFPLNNLREKDTNKPPKKPFVSKCNRFTKYFSQLGPALMSNKHCNNSRFFLKSVNNSMLRN